MAITVAGLAGSSQFAGTLFRLLAEEGLADDALKTLVNDTEARSKAVEFLNTLSKSSEINPAYQQARDILGDDFISPQDIANAWGFTYTDEQLKLIAENLPDQRTLRWARDNGFVVIASAPKRISLAQMREYDSEIFNNDTSLFNTPASLGSIYSDYMPYGTWLVIKKTPDRRSIGQKLCCANDLMGDNERFPNAGEATWFFATYIKLHGNDILPLKRSTRTSSRAIGVNNLCIGLKSNGKLHIFEYNNKGRYGGLGLMPVLNL